MERPSHELRHSMVGATNTKRLGGASVVVIVQLAVGALLVLGMTSGAIEKKLEDLQATVQEQQVEEKAPPPPPPDVVKPPPPFVPPPDIAIAVEAPASNTNTITASSTPPPPRPAAPPAPPPPPPPPPTKAEPIARTHTKPPYPAISQRMGEQGTTEMMVVVGPDGVPAQVEVTKSSGSQRLDNAAVEHVKARWRWVPPTSEGKPVSVRAPIRIVWNILDAQ